MEMLSWCKGVARGVLGCPWPPLLQAFFNQTTYNRWRKCHDDTLAIVTIWWVPSLWHSVTPPLENPGYAHVDTDCVEQLWPGLIYRAPVVHVIYQTQQGVFHQISILNLRSGLKKRGVAEAKFFLTNFEMFRYLMKHSFICLMYLLKALILREVQSKGSLNFMIIRITYLNLLHGIDFLCFLSMNY